MSAVVETLRKARELITPEGAWGQGAYQCGECFCVVGALIAADSVVSPKAHEDDYKTYNYARDLLDEVASGSAIEWNDDPFRTQVDAIALYDRAIALAETEAAQ